MDGYIRLSELTQVDLDRLITCLKDSIDLLHTRNHYSRPNCIKGCAACEAVKGMEHALHAIEERRFKYEENEMLG